MRIGLFSGPSDIEALIAKVGDASARGFESFWMPQIFEADAITMLGVIGHAVPGIALGTAVVPTYPRHPFMLAAQSRTVQQLSGGRFTLGIGLSHQIVIESMLGMSYDKPVRHLREYLDILMPLLHGEPASAAGETLTFHGSLDIPSEPVPVVVAALGTQMLGLAARRTEGTITWMTGPATLADHVAPTITAAASDAGRPAPRIVNCLPVAVTDDPDGAHAHAAKLFEMYGYLPSYRAMLDREGAAGPGDVAIVGDEAAVRAGIEAVFAAGATEFVAAPFTNTERTLDALSEIAAA